MLKKMFYLLSMVSLLAFATGCEDEKKDEVVVDYTSTGDITLGASGNVTYKTAFDADTQTPISTSSITAADQAKVDFVFLNDDATVSAFYAPSAVASGSIAAWGTKNATQFVALTLTAAQWDALTSAQKIKDAFTGESSNKGAAVAVGKYYGFKTVGNKYGVIKVTGFTASSSGTVTFQMKIANAASSAAVTLFNF